MNENINLMITVKATNDNVEVYFGIEEAQETDILLAFSVLCQSIIKSGIADKDELIAAVMIGAMDVEQKEDEQ